MSCGVNSVGPIQPPCKLLALQYLSACPTFPRKKKNRGSTPQGLSTEPLRRVGFVGTTSLPGHSTLPLWSQTSSEDDLESHRDSDSGFFFSKFEKGILCVIRLFGPCGDQGYADNC